MGRHAIYTDVDVLQAKIDEYFLLCGGTPALDADGLPRFSAKGVPLYVVPPKPPTITGLAFFLGFAGRQALINYANRPKFKDTIARAKLRIETYTEERLFDRDGQRGAEFSLRCNFGWGKETVDDGDKLGDIIKAIENAAK